MMMFALVVVIMRVFVLMTMIIVVVMVAMLMVFMRVGMLVLVVVMRVRMIVLLMIMVVRMIVAVAVIVQVHVKLHAIDPGFLRALRMNVITLHFQGLKLAFEFLEIRPQVEHCPHEHVAADAAENVEVKRVHSSSPAANALIWLAA
jgi:hypothetical protein